MRIIDRFVLFVLSLGMLKLSLCMFLVGFGIIRPDYLYDFFNGIYGSPDLRWMMIVASIIFFVFSFRFLIFVFRRHQPKERGVDQSTELGPVSISFETIESLSLNGARRVRGVRDAVAHIGPYRDQISIKIRVVVDGQHPIQEIIERVQQGVKEQVETIAGVGVNQVSVYVDQVVRPDHSRVRVQ